MLITTIRLLFLTLLFLNPIFLFSQSSPKTPSLPETQVFKKDKKSVSLSNYKKEDEILILAFGASTCPITSTYWKRIKGAWYNHRNNKVKMLLIGGNADDTMELLEKSMKDHDLDLPMVWDPQHRLAQSLGINFTPLVVILGRDWSVLYRGRIDDNWRDEEFVQEKYLEAAITKALEDKKSIDRLDDHFLGSKMR